MDLGAVRRCIVDAHKKIRNYLWNGIRFLKLEAQRIFGMSLRISYQGTNSRFFRNRPEMRITADTSCLEAERAKH
jgi:hypothetical protein